MYTSTQIEKSIDLLKSKIILYSEKVEKSNYKKSIY